MTNKTPHDTLEAQVVIVGGGPVGLVLGMDLAGRGVDVLLLEQHSYSDRQPPRTNHISSRSMEILRRLGVADDIRAVGLPADYPQDVVYYTSLGRPEIGRIPIPAASRRRMEDTQGLDVWWPTPEPSHRVNQTFTDPVLVAHARGTLNLRILESHYVETVQSRSDSVAIRGRRLIKGDEFRAEAEFVIGCDGAASNIRKIIGAELAGDPFVQQVETLLFRSPDVLQQLKGGPAWQQYFINTRQSGTIIALDGRETWLANFRLEKGEEPTDQFTRLGKLRAMLGVGANFPIEVLELTDYVGRRLVADKFREHRLFICGDAAHIWIPFAGYGMNAALADAEDLAWTLAAFLNGWAGATILDAYEAERRPVTDQVSQYAMNIAFQLRGKGSSIVPFIEEDSPRGLAARRMMGKEMWDIGRKQYCAGGLNYGYYYDKSPIIAYDGAEHPSYTMDSFVQTTVPGHRTPHIWLADGRSLYDAMGPGFALIRNDASVDADSLMRAAEQRGVPITLVDIDGTEPVYDYPLVLSRPDHHVAWRGTVAPSDSLALIDLVCGFGTSVS